MEINKEGQEMHTLHIELSEELFQKVRIILPERGQITSLIRRFLRSYITRFDEEGKTTSILEKESKDILSEDISRGIVELSLEGDPK